MASVAVDKRGSRFIQFVAGKHANGKLIRPSIYLGKGISQDAAERFAGFVDRLLIHRGTGGVLADQGLADWLQKLDDRWYAKLAKVGLVEPREAAGSVTIGAFTREYIDGRNDIKEDTRRGLEDAREFYQWMTSDQRKTDGKVCKLGGNTAKRRAGRAKQFFAHAVRKRIIDRNPFDGLKCRVGGSPDRLKFIAADVIEAVLKEITDKEFRAAVILARWGGLRIPSELIPLKWGDVNWGKKRLTVHVPKLEHIEGKDTRIVPLFPEVERALAALYDEPYRPEEPVFQRLRDPGANLRTQFERYIERAGLTPWPKLWQNLRASRATELAEQYPAHVATAWLGHTQAVAEQHYWQMREKYFEMAVAGNQPAGALQNAQHEKPEAAGNDQKQERKEPEAEERKPQDLPGNSGDCRVLQESLGEDSVALVGLEPTRFMGDGF